MSTRSLHEIAKCGTWIADLTDSRVLVLAKRLGIVVASARLRVLSAEVVVDEAGVPVSLSVQIDPENIVTSRPRLGRRIEAKGILRRNGHEDLRFFSTDFQPLVRGFRAVGSLEARGMSSRQSLRATAIDWIGDEVARVSGSGRVDLRNIGLKRRDLLSFSPKVIVSFELDFRLSKIETEVVLTASEPK